MLGRDLLGYDPPGLKIIINNMFKDNYHKVCLNMIRVMFNENYQHHVRVQL